MCLIASQIVVVGGYLNYTITHSQLTFSDKTGAVKYKISACFLSFDIMATYIEMTV